MAEKYLEKTVIQLRQWNTRDGVLQRKALVLTYRAIFLIILVITIIAIALGGFVYAKFNQKVNIIENTKSMAKFTEQALYSMAAQQKEILNKLPPTFSKPLPSQLTPEEFINKYGSTAKLHVEVADYFKNSEFKQCIEAADELLTKEGLSDDLKKDTVIKKAWSYFYLKDYKNTDITIAAAIEKYPDLYPLLHLRLDLLIMSGDMKEAEKLLAILEKEAPTIELLFSKANLSWQTGKTDDAIGMYQRIMASNNLRLILSSANNLALIYAKEKQDFSRARFYVTMMQAMAPFGFTTQRTTGKVLLMQKDYKSAEIALQKAEKIFPNNLDIILSLSILYEKTGDKAKKQEYLEKAAKLDKNHAAKLADLKKSMNM